MGKNSARSSPEKYTVIFLIALCTLTTTSCRLSSAVSVNATPNINPHMQRLASQYIDAFRKGASFKHNQPIDEFLAGTKAHPEALVIFKKELLVSSAHVRENIVRMMEAIGIALDTPSARKVPIVRDKNIISILVNEGFAKNDGGAAAAERALRQRVMPVDLSHFSDTFLRTLAQSQGNYLLIAAKAKTKAALPYVDKMASQKEWQEDPDYYQLIRATQAALGNSTIETEFINSLRDAEQGAPPAPRSKFYDMGGARDGSVVAERLHWLGLIGTRRTLQVACEYLRSPLKSYVEDVSEESIRFHALAAIRYNYPDEEVLYRPRTQKAWEEAEEFCTRFIGATFDGPTPNPPRDRLYPTQEPAN